MPDVDPEVAATQIANMLKALGVGTSRRASNATHLNSYQRATALMQPATGNQPTPATIIPNTAAQAGPDAVQSAGIGQPFEGSYAHTGEFGESRPGHTHAGIDFGVPAGTPLLAIDNGTVIQAGDDGSGYGINVIIDADGLNFLYGHMSEVDVHPGDQVTKGQVLGLSGSTGQSTGPHLHFEVRQNGTPIDPNPILAGASQAVIASPKTPRGATPDKVIPADPKEIAAAQAQNVVAILSGQEPGSQLPGDTIEKGTPGTQSQSGVPGDITGDWITDILDGIGAPHTPENIHMLDLWIRFEAGAVHNNALNTTQVMNAGETAWNDLGNGIHVWSYPSYEVGLAATLQTLNQSNMAGIANALRAGDGYGAAQALASSHWGTGDAVVRNF